MKLGDIVSRVVIDSRKLTDYALNPDNPVGADKAVIFQRLLSFNLDNYQLLLLQISTQALNGDAPTPPASGRCRLLRYSVRVAWREAP